MEEIIIIGAGPCGLSAAVALKKRGIDPLVLDKGSLVHSIYRYPTYMIFHSTPELLEIGQVPFTTPNEKPTRLEALHYYRMVAKRYDIRVQTFEVVGRIEQVDKHFVVSSTDRFGTAKQYETKRVVIATGYFDNPNRLGIPGEELPKVSSFYTEAHPYAGMQVAIVGGNNSAVDAAMDLERAGAHVTVICRGEKLSSRVKAWTRPIFEGLCEKGRIKVYYSSEIQEITDRMVIIKNPEGITEIPNDFVFSLIGYRPDRQLLQSLGVELDQETGAPIFNPTTMETNVPGVFVAGVIVSSAHANEIFIENGRFHGEVLAKSLTT
ncbi:YpdA family putative bacillithiol disulfide reductase [Brevibacillus halotolerans]|uniref:YpdA family putative bacillithiol disulfide reductase n=1 Tax=Brevibacillus TaxID=55080 RepID=UPI00215B9356|nr:MULTISPECIES: YpdA family putative bacillithiol disulfide reductase [Brevibacillus]MCR8962716.1 YpdA family putative bacillithiol disulfide reductase [Brevibacillus laterosporus]MCZ0834871.1 YpdA family putative bacillithiol disulfide reductase [Brevibacillus halotolerans]